MKIKKNQAFLLSFSIFIFYLIFNFFCSSTKKINIRHSIPLETSPAVLNSKAIMDIKDAFELLLKESSKYIYINAPYFTSNINQNIINELRNAIIRGVKVKFLLADTPFSRQEFSKLNFKRYNNVEIQFADISELGANSYGEIHAKYAIFDGVYAILGSANFSYPAFNDNIEINVLIVDGPVIKDLENVFDLDWNFAKGKSFDYTYKPLPGSITTLLESAPDPINYSFIMDIKEILIELFENAKKEINLEVYVISYKKQFFPFYYDLFKKARSRGVEVKILISQSTYEVKNGDKNKYLNMRSVISDLQKIGVKIRKLNIWDITGNEYNSLHSKLLIIDNKFAMLGSNNWTESAISENREIAILTTNDQIVKPLKKKFDRDWNSKYSEPIY